MSTTVVRRAAVRRIAARALTSKGGVLVALLAPGLAGLALAMAMPRGPVTTVGALLAVALAVTVGLAYGAARYAAASVGLMAIASANGAVRDLTYGRRLPARRAHLLSLLPALGAFAAYASRLQRRRPIPTARGAAEIGLMWAGTGLAFELAIGRSRGASWTDLRDHYDPTAGGTGLLVLVGAAASPLAAYVGRRDEPR